jgi:hypothetical protein
MRKKPGGRETDLEEENNKIRIQCKYCAIT